MKLKILRIGVFLCVLSAVLVFGIVARNALFRPSVAAIAEQSLPSVLQLEMYDLDGDKTGFGTGFVVSRDGRVVTNYHVVSDIHTVRAKAENGATFSISGVLASDETNDLIVLQMEAKDLPFLKLGKSARVKAGDPIVVVGSPLGLSGTVSEGIVSAKQRRLTSNSDLFQITAPISHGSSGSPVLASDGMVIGVASRGSASGQALNFAIPVAHLRALLDGIDENRRPQPFPKTTYEVSTADDWPVQEPEPIQDSLAARLAYEYSGEDPSSEVVEEFVLLLAMTRAYYTRSTDRQIKEAIYTVHAASEFFPSVDLLHALDELVYEIPEEIYVEIEEEVLGLLERTNGSQKLSEVSYTTTASRSRVRRTGPNLRDVAVEIYTEYEDAYYAESRAEYANELERQRQLSEQIGRTRKRMEQQGAEWNEHMSDWLNERQQILNDRAAQREERYRDDVRYGTSRRESGIRRYRVR